MKIAKSSISVALLGLVASSGVSAECPYSLSGEWRISSSDYVNLHPTPAVGDKVSYSGYISDNQNLVARVTTFCNSNKEQLVNAELSNPGKAPYEILSGMVNPDNPYEITFDVTKSGDPNSGPLRQWKKRQ